eukprot:jgi/Psemu1/282251/fgenesh1_pg.4_\
MSGRLIILSKKGYCPWNTRNLARIETDEKEHREAQEREAEKHAHISSRARVAALKKTGPGKAEHQGRFNLLESGDEAHFDRAIHSSHEKESKGSRGVHGRESKTMDDETTNKNTKKKRFETTFHKKFGDFRMTEKSSAESFYMLARTPQESLERKEIQRKRDMDPMKNFTPEDLEVGEDISLEKTTYSRYSTHDGNAMFNYSHNLVSLSVNANDFSQGEKTMRKRSQESYCSNKCSDGGRISAHTPDHDKRNKRKKKRHKRDDSSKRRKGNHRSSGGKRSRCSSDTSNGTDSFEQLRKKRTEREKQERTRQDKLFA